eukprot:901679-Amphidinium_carterae.1
METPSTSHCLGKFSGSKAVIQVSNGGSSSFSPLGPLTFLIASSVVMCCKSASLAEFQSQNSLVLK